MEKTNVKVTFAGNPVTLVGKEIKVGDNAPEFIVLDQGLQPKKLSDYAGMTRIISVYPSIDTGVCAAQTHRFNKEAGAMQNAKIISVSNDLPFALKRFCGAEGIDNLEVLSDYKDLEFGTKYGFLIQELRLLARGVVVIDKDDVVRHVEYVSEITDQPDYDKALEVAKQL